jgi:hypothetical protein
MRAILERLCGPPARQNGSHAIFISPKTGEQFVYGYHDNREIRGSQVRLILVTEVGLTEREARREAR